MKNLFLLVAVSMLLLLSGCTTPIVANADKGSELKAQSFTPKADKGMQGAMETVLVQGLQQNYIVFAGEQVAQKAHEIFLKESHNTTKKECDETRCMQGIAESFQAELIATDNVTKPA